MQINPYSTTPIDLGPFLSSSGVLVTTGTPTLVIRVNGTVQSSGLGTVSAVDSHGHATYTPSGNSDTGTSGELAIDATLSGAVLWSRKDQVWPLTTQDCTCPLLISAVTGAPAATLGVYLPKGVTNLGRTMWGSADAAWSLYFNGTTWVVNKPLTGTFTAAVAGVQALFGLYNDGSGNTIAVAPHYTTDASVVGDMLGILGSGVVQVTSFVTASGDITIIRGCDHKFVDGAAWKFTDPGTWPSLAGGSVELSMRLIGVNTDPAPLILTGTILAGPPQVIYFEAAASVTAALAPSQTPDSYTFDIVATLASGHKYPILPEGSATVVCNVTGTGLPVGQPTPVAIKAGSLW